MLATMLEVFDRVRSKGKYTVTLIQVVLGREGMGEPSETDFDAWVTYVADYFDSDPAWANRIQVLPRTHRDRQTNLIVNASDEEQGALRVALATAWVDYCMGGEG